MRGDRVQQLTPEQVGTLVTFPEQALALQGTVTVMHHLAEQITQVEQAVKAQVHLRPAFQALSTVPGIGQILTLTIMLETGEIRRFLTVGSSPRTVDAWAVPS